MGRFRIYGCQVKFSVDFIKNAKTVRGRETITRTYRVSYNYKNGAQGALLGDAPRMSELRTTVARDQGLKVSAQFP